MTCTIRRDVHDVHDKARPTCFHGGEGQGVGTRLGAARKNLLGVLLAEALGLQLLAVVEVVRAVL